jgi:hypothetical protein
MATDKDKDKVEPMARPAPWAGATPRRGEGGDPAPSTRATGLLLALSLGVVYALTSAGRLVSFDGGVMYDTAARIVDHHTLALLPHHHGMPGVGGGFYSKYGIAQSLAEIPLYVVGKGLEHPLGHGVAMATTLLTNSVVTALAVLLFFLLACELGAGRRGAVLSALLLGLASPYWPYAKTDFSEPLSALALTGAVLFLARARARPGTASYLLAGLFVALGILTKLTILFALPALGLYALYVARYAGPKGRALPRFAAWGGMVGVGLAAAAAYNVARYGRLTDTGYRSTDDLPFHAPLLHGLQGLLVSSGKGLLWYCPLVFLALALWPLLLRRRRAEGLLALGVILPTLVVFGTYPVWWGGHCWGPRYLLPLLPLLLLPLAFARAAPAPSAIARRAAVALVALSIAVQALGVAVDGERFLQTGFLDAREQQALWVARDTPLLGQGWLLAYDAARVVDPRVAAGMIVSYPWRHPTGASLRQRLAIDGRDYWWWQALGRYGLSPLAGLAIAALALLLLGIALARARGRLVARARSGSEAAARAPSR